MKVNFELKKNIKTIISILDIIMIVLLLFRFLVLAKGDFTV